MHGRTDLPEHDGMRGRAACNSVARIFLSRLRLLTDLGEAELELIAQLVHERRLLRAKAEITTLRSRSQRLYVLLEGWACRYRLLADGRRQITTLLIPGDICNLDALHVPQGNRSLATLTECEVATIDAAVLRDLTLRQPRIGKALGWLSAVENAKLAERNVCLGRCTAREHVAHLLCELLVRLTMVGLAKGNGFTCPITQEEIGDVLGLTSVHVNRVLQALRGEGVIEQQGRTLIIREWSALRRKAGFRPDYLHLQGMSGNGRDFSAAPWAFDAASSSALELSEG